MNLKLPISAVSSKLDQQNILTVLPDSGDPKAETLNPKVSKKRSGNRLIFFVDVIFWLSLIGFCLGAGFFVLEIRGEFSGDVAKILVEENKNKQIVASPRVEELDFKEAVFKARIQSDLFSKNSREAPIDPALYRVLNGTQFKEIYEETVIKYPNVTILNTKPIITGDALADKRIQEIAETRGYVLRPQALEDTLVVTDNEQKIQKEVLNSWLELKETALADGIKLELISAYRSPDDQRKIFQNSLSRNATPAEIAGGKLDSDINKILETISIPGYSRHHTGFTVDFSCGTGELTQFGKSACYEWISAFNYLNAKRFGFIPSYPQDAGKQGPEPEPWEYVWVGERQLRS